MKLLLLPALGVLLSVLLSTPSRAQSLDDVRRAVDAYFGSDEESAPAKADLARWGNGALPHLRTLADQRLGAGGFAVVCAAHELETLESLDFLVEVLDGRTRLMRGQALGLLSVTLDRRLARDDARAHLLEHPRFEPAVRHVAEHGSWVERGQAAEMAATLGWEHFAPLVEAMLEDDNVSLRRTAAAALERLTGRTVEVALPAAVFPGERPIPELVLGPVPVPSDGEEQALEALLVRCKEDEPCLMFGDGRRFVSYSSTGAPGDVRTFPLPAIDVRVLEPVDEPRQWVALTSLSGFAGAGADLAISWSETGEELWRFEPPRRGLDTFAILHADEGPYGVVFGPGGGDEGIVALDAAGRRLWTAPSIVLYELRTHPELPGVVLVVGGDHDLLGHSPSGVEVPPPSRRSASHFYATIGVLYPGAGGGPERVVAGSGESSTPTLRAFDRNGGERWTVTLPHRITQLELLEVEGRERLFVVATEGADLLLLDSSGALRWRGRLHDLGPNESFPVFELVAGGYGRNEAAIAVRTRAGYVLYPIDVESLPEAR